MTVGTTLLFLPAATPVDLAAIRARGQKYFTDVCFLKPEELYSYLGACLIENSRDWPVNDDMRQFLQLFLQCKTMQNLQQELNIPRQTLTEWRRKLSHEIGIELPAKMAIEPDDYAAILMRRILQKAGVEHSKTIVILYQPPSGWRAKQRKHIRADFFLWKSSHARAL